MSGYYYVGRDENLVAGAPTFSAWTLDTYGFQHQAASEGYTVVNQHVNVQADHAAGIRQVAAAGSVLLKNKGSLPLTGKEKLTGVFGYDAGANPDGPNGCSDRGCDNGTLAMGWGSGTANFPYLVDPLAAITEYLDSKGSDIEGITDNYAYSQINLLAERVDEVGGAAIVFVNSDSGEG